VTATALPDPITDPALRPAPGPLRPKFTPPAGWPHVRSTDDRAYCLCGAVWVQAMTCHPCQQSGHPAEACVDGPGELDANGRTAYPDRGAGRWCSCQHAASPRAVGVEIHVQMPGLGKVPGYLAKALADSTRQMDHALRQRLAVDQDDDPPAGELVASRRAATGPKSRALLTEACHRVAIDIRCGALSPMIEGLYSAPPPDGRLLSLRTLSDG
jgi:hypothetical protein